MAKSLIITEKPSVARDIVETLGGFKNHDDEYWENDSFICTFAVGHVLELQEPEDIDPQYKRWTLQNLPIIPDQFKWKPKKEQKGRLKVIEKLIDRNDVESLINACDAGREGELIFREIAKHSETTKPIQRLWLQSMTSDSIKKGFSKLQDGKKFEGLGAAGECRSLSDWLIGMNASRALTIRLRSRAMKEAWSAGRVQTPTLALLVERELEILAHLPKPYWRVLGQFQVNGQSYEGAWYDPKFVASEEDPEKKSDRIFDEAMAQKIVSETLGKTGSASETRKPSRESAPRLFDLTSLQREANSRFGWSAARTLQAAQRCYEAHKVLTYPRTDSKCLPNDYVAEVEKVIDILAGVPEYKQGATFLKRNGRQNDGKVFNDAGVSDHFAIIPTGVIGRSLRGDDEKLFDFVTRRFLAAFHPPAVWEQVDRQTVVAGHQFQSKARSLREPGWRAVFDQTAAEDESQKLPALIDGADQAEGVQVAAAEVKTETDVTRPPPRITEARLLSLMENAGKQIEDEEIAAALQEKGLGTPATRADIIENLKAKNYVDSQLRPTVKGIRLIDLLHRIKVNRLTSAELTGELEMHLGQVEHNQRKAKDFMQEITDYTRDIVEKASKFNFDEIYPNEKPLGICPCPNKRPVYERGWFYRCQEDPAEIEAGTDCPFRIWKDKSGRYLDRQTVEILLKNGTTGEIDGFKDRRGRPFKAILVIEDLKVEMKPVAGSEGAADLGEIPQFEVNPEPLGPSPVAACQEFACQVIETPTHFMCTHRLKQIEEKAKKPVGFALPRLVCKREITRAEAIEYMKNGTTPLIEDFISRYGRPFKAMLKLGEDGRHKFEFPPREGGAKGGRRGRWGKKGGGDDEKNAATTEAKTTKSKKKTTKKGAVNAPAADDGAVSTTAVKTAKKAPAKKAASKKTTAKKTTAKKTTSKKQTIPNDTE